MKGLILIQFLLSIDDDDYIRGRPYDLNLSMVDNKRIRDISKRDSSLAPSELD